MDYLRDPPAFVLHTQHAEYCGGHWSDDRGTGTLTVCACTGLLPGFFAAFFPAFRFNAEIWPGESFFLVFIFPWGVLDQAVWVCTLQLGKFVV